MQWLMLQQDKPEDFVIATGVQYSVRDFVNAAAKELGMTDHLEWQGRRRERLRCRRQVHRRGRSALLPARRSRDAARRRQQGQTETRLGTAH